MTAYAPNFTARARVHYHAAGHNHVQTWRLPGTPGPTEIGALEGAIGTYYSTIADLLYDDFAFLAFTIANADSNIFLPVSFSIGFTGAVALSGRPVSVGALSTTFVGRTVTGGPWKLVQYGLDFPTQADNVGADFRVNAGESITLDAATGNLLTAAGTNDFIGNDGTAVVVYAYADVAYNATWKRKIRGTGSVFA